MCLDSSTNFARDGTLITIVAPKFQHPDCIIALPTSHKITRRNNRGEVIEAYLLIEGELAEKERYELEYDSVGNWIKLATIKLRVYEIEGDSWKAGEWGVQNICHRTIEYYP